VGSRIYVLTLNGALDIRASHIQGRGVVLGKFECRLENVMIDKNAIGAVTKVVYIPDIDSSTTPEYLRTKSDVLSVDQKHVCVYVCLILRPSHKQVAPHLRRDQKWIRRKV